MYNILELLIAAKSGDYWSDTLNAKKVDRHRAAKKIGQYLANLPQDRAKEVIDAIEQMRNTQSSLQQWTDIIVTPDNS